MKHFFRKATAVLLAIAMTASLVMTGAFAAGSTTVEYTLKYEQSMARDTLQYVNTFRTGDDAWYWNSDNTTKTYVNELNELVYDYDLEEAAMQRAAEIAIYFSHTRPDGQSWSTAITESGYKWMYAGENLAAGTARYAGSASSAITMLREDNEDYSGQGHRRNMLGANYTNYAMACVYLNNAYYWAMVLSTPQSGSNPNTTNETTPTVSEETVKVKVDDSYIQFSSSTFHDMPMNVGDAYDLPEINLCIKPTFAGTSSAVVNVENASNTPEWTSSDSSVASIENGQIKGNSIGTAKISATLNNTTVSFDAIVGVTVQYVPEESSSCTAHGHSEYWYAVETDQYFTDESLKNEVQYEDLILPLGSHDYSDLSLAYTTDPTCTSEGYTYHVCKYCGNEYVYEIIPATNHDYEKTTTSIPGQTKDPTCTTDGAYMYVCKNCGRNVLMTVPATGHDWTEWELHDYSNYTTETRECKNCHTVETIQNPCITHDYGEPTFSWHYVDEAEYTDSGELGTMLVDPNAEITCTAEYECSVCQETYTEDCNIEIGENIHSNCEDSGTMVITATTSDGEYSSSETVSTIPQNHKWAETGVAIPATCAEDGTTEYTCEDCGSTEYIKNIAKTDDHVWDEESVLFDWDTSGDYPECHMTITCDVCGLTDTVKCDVYLEDVIGVQSCGEEELINYIAYIEYDGIEYYDELPTIILPVSSEHDWGVGVIEREPTETEDGIVVFTCTICGDTYGKTIEYGTEEWSEYFDWGTDYETCDVTFINEWTTGRYGPYECEVEEINRVDPTCTEAGSTDKIARYYYDGKIVAESDTGTVTLPALGHEIADGEKPAMEWTWDYSTGGYICTATYECSRCGEVITLSCNVTIGADENGEDKYIATVTIGDKTFTSYHDLHSGHDWDVESAQFTWSSDLSTCTATMVCSVCGEGSGPIPCSIEAIMQEWQDNECQGTLTASFTYEGYSAFETEILDYKENENGTFSLHVLFASGNNEWEDISDNLEPVWVVTKEPTCTEPGLEEKIIIYGDLTTSVLASREIEATGHDWSYTFTWSNGAKEVSNSSGEVSAVQTYASTAETDPPTCTVTFKCGTCGESYGPLDCTVEEIESNDYNYCAYYISDDGSYVISYAQYTPDTGTSGSGSESGDNNGSDSNSGSGSSDNGSSSSGSTSTSSSNTAAEREQLEEDIDIAENLSSDEYTSESWDALETALEHAKAVLADDDATEEEISEAIEELENAIQELVPAQSTTSTGSNTVGDTSDTSNTTSDDNNNTTTSIGASAQGTGTDGKSSTETDAPKTGDAGWFMATGIGILAIIGIGATIRIRRKEEI